MQQRTSVIALITLASVVLASVLWFGSSEPTPPGHVEYRARVLDPDLTGGANLPHSGDVLTWGSDGTVMRSSNGTEWRPLATPTTAGITKVSFDGADTWVAVGEAGTLLVSTDNGKLWQERAPDSFRLTINDVLYLSPNENLPLPEQGLWLAVAADGHFLSSSDGGHHWQTSRLDTEDDLLTLTWLKDPGRLLVGGENGLIGSSENGAAWRMKRVDTQTPITGFHVFDNLLLGKSAWGRLLVSRDAGESWRLIQTEKSVYFNDAAYDPNHHSIVLTSHNGHILHSNDNGQNWRFVEAPYQGTRHSLGDVFFDPPTQTLLAFGSHGAVVQSKDGGLSWQSRPSGVRHSFTKVLYHPEREEYLALGPRGFRAVSADAAGSWTVTREGFDFYWREGVTTDSGAIVLAGELGKMLRSESAGDEWEYVELSYPNPRTPPTYRALTSLDSGALLAAGPTGLILRSQDEGETWQVVHHTPFSKGEAFTDLMVAPDGHSAIAVEAREGPYHSSDEGQSWSREPLIDNRNFWQGSVLKLKDRAIAIAVGQKGLLAVSENAGENWQRVELAALSGTALAGKALTEKDLYGSFASQTHQALFAFGESGALLRSTDGLHWQMVTVPTDTTLRRMLQVPASNTLIAFGEQGTIIRSVDGGVHWQPIPSGVNAELRAGLVEPDTGNPVILGRSGTLLRSQDDGLNWERLPTHTQAHFRNGVTHPKTGDLFVFGDRIVHMQRQTP